MKAATRLTGYSPPGGRHAPPEVLAELREIDPMAELVYIGEARWLMGKYSEDADKRVKAIRQLEKWAKTVTRLDPTAEEGLKARLPAIMDRWREKRLKAMGFQPFQSVFYSTDPDSAFVEIFRSADWIWKFAWREAERSMEAETDGTADQDRRKKELLDRFNQVHKGVWKHVFRKPTQTTNQVDIQNGAIVRSA
mgnify:CR=1 FL=1